MTDFDIIEPFETPSPREVAHAPEVLALPAPEVSFEIRPATVADIPWIDGLQKQSTRSLGFWSFEMLKGYIEKGNVHVAIATRGKGTADFADCTDSDCDSSAFRFLDPSAQSADSAESAVRPSESRLGYCIAADRYFKREDTGIIYQMNIAPGSRRSYLASNFLQRVWDTWPWGVKLCGLWCAQDLEANNFWEKCGFKAIAFRAGSAKKKVTNLDGSSSAGRVHIYWQKRIRPRKPDGMPDDTPHWFPSQTGGGAIREDRVVFPIPPEVHWSQAAPRFLPGVNEVFEAMAADREVAERETMKLLAGPPEPRKTRQEKAELKRERDAAIAQQTQRSTTMADGGLSFARPAPPAPEAEAAAHAAQADGARRDKAAAKKEAKQAGERAAAKNHPVLVNLARELRDRWVEAATPGSAMEARLLGASACGGVAAYDVARRVECFAGSTEPRTPKRVENVKRLAA